MPPLVAAPLRRLLLASLLAVASAQFGGPPKPKISGERKEVPALLCETCAAVLAGAFAAVEVLRSEAQGKQLGEEEINGALEALCDPTQEAGYYLRRFDVVEDARRSRTLLKLKEQESVGKCEKECETLALACRRILDEALDVEELVVALYLGKKTEAELVQALCKDGEACEDAPVALPKGYERKDEAFQPIDESALAMEKMMAQMNAMGYGDQLNMMSSDDMAGMGGMDDPYGDMDMGDFGDMDMGGFGGMGEGSGMDFGGAGGFGQDEEDGYYGEDL